MQYVRDGLKFYYNKEVYSPEYSSVDTVMLVNKLIADGRPNLSVLDVGCGSGIIGLSIKKANPDAYVILCDVSPEAVRVSKLNSKRLGLPVEVRNGHLAICGADIIVANLPTYSDEDMKQELHGPEISYYAGDPLSIYDELFKTASCRALVCECQIKYQPEFLKLAKKRGWVLVLSLDNAFAFTKHALI